MGCWERCKCSNCANPLGAWSSKGQKMDVVETALKAASEPVEMAQSSQSTNLPPMSATARSNLPDKASMRTTRENLGAIAHSRPQVSHSQNSNPNLDIRPPANSFRSSPMPESSRAPSKSEEWEPRERERNNMQLEEMKVGKTTTEQHSLRQEGGSHTMTDERTIERFATNKNEDSGEHRRASEIMKEKRGESSRNQSNSVEGEHNVIRGDAQRTVGQHGAARAETQHQQRFSQHVPQRTRYGQQSTASGNERRVEIIGKQNRVAEALRKLATTVTSGVRSPISATSEDELEKSAQNNP